MLKLLKKIIKKIIKSTIIFLFPLRNVILFESAPDLADNTKPVFDELVRREYNKKYKMIWLCYDEVIPQRPFIENIQYLSVRKHKIKTILLNYTARICICCNRFIIGCGRKNQQVFYLMHGTPVKDVSSYYTCPTYINYMLTSGKGVNELCAVQFNIPINNCIALGYPRNDELYKHIQLSQYFGNYKKYIVWYPTVRQFKGGKLTGSSHTLPLIHDSLIAEKINAVAKEEDVLIILKPHFAQDTSYLTEKSLSNIKIINDRFFVENQISSYQFVGSTDALLTDYSSIYYDYLLCDKPIGLIWEDIDEYLKDPGLIPNYEEYLAGGEKIYSADELISFIRDIRNGKDSLELIRKRICKFVNESIKPDNAKRVVDFIISNM